MLSTLSTLEYKSVGVYVRERSRGHNVEKLYARNSENKDVTPSVEIS